MAEFPSFYGWNLYISHIFTHSSTDGHRFNPCPGYCKYCCNEHGGYQKLFLLSSVYPSSQSRDSFDETDLLCLAVKKRSLKESHENLKMTKLRMPDYFGSSSLCASLWVSKTVPFSVSTFLCLFFSFLSILYVFLFYPFFSLFDLKKLHHLLEDLNVKTGYYKTPRGNHRQNTLWHKSKPYFFGSIS